jgi:hypothetical protein
MEKNFQKNRSISGYIGDFSANYGKHYIEISIIPEEDHQKRRHVFVFFDNDPDKVLFKVLLETLKQAKEAYPKENNSKFGLRIELPNNNISIKYIDDGYPHLSISPFDYNGNDTLAILNNTSRIVIFKNPKTGMMIEIIFPLHKWQDFVQKIKKVPEISKESTSTLDNYV